MSLFKIAWRSIQQRSLASSLTAFSMALGVMLVVAVLMILGLVTEQFRNNSSLGYDLIVGAKGGKLQLVLNTVYHLSRPIETIPYSRYLDFLPADQRPDGEPGRFARYTRFVIPLCMGDYYQEYLVVGTTPLMFEYVYDEGNPDDPADDRRYEFAEGRNFQTYSEEYGYFEGVIGSRVAATTGLKIGDTFAPTHAGPEGEAHDNTFVVVGILAPSGTPNDRSVFVNMEGFFLLEGHAKPLPEEEEEDSAAPAESAPADAAPAEPHPEDAAPEATAPQSVSAASTPAAEQPHYLRLTTPLPIEERELTALLVRTSDSLFSRSIVRQINESDQGQAVFPIREIFVVLDVFVTPFQRLLLIITTLICVVSGISILVSIYNSMSQRQHEIAVIRSLGAGRNKVMMIVLLEAIILALGGGFLGWIGGHAVVSALSPVIEARTGVQVGFFDFAPVLEFPPGSPIISISPEVILIPGLMLLAVVVGFLPAVAAYRTDVAKALSANP